jgi:hypothetical protein
VETKKSRHYNFFGHRWLTPVILATQEEESRRIMVPSQPGANSSQDPISKKTHHKKGLVEWLKGQALSSSPSTSKENYKKPPKTNLKGAKCYL